MLQAGFVLTLDPGRALALVPTLAIVFALDGTLFHAAGLALAPVAGFPSEIQLLLAQRIAAGIEK